MIIADADSFVRYFDRVRGRTRKVVACIPEDRLEWTPRPGAFTLADIVRHLAGAERWMWAENVQGRPSRYPGCGPEVAAGHESAAGYMDALHQDAIEIFAGLTAEQLERRCPTPGGVTLPTWKWLRAMVEHEVHHRGQLYTMLGLLDVETPPLYGLTERQVFDNSEPLNPS